MPNKFTSIQYPFGIDAGTGQWAKEAEYERHVVQLIKQVLLTGPGERINHPDFGCGLRRMVFAPNSEVSAALAQVTILEALQRWLSSVIQVSTVSVAVKNELLEVKVAYVLRTTQEKRILNLEVTP